MSTFDLKRWLQQSPYNCQPSSPCLFILMGLSGSGKSSVGRFLADQFNAALFCSDTERQRRYAGLEDQYSSVVTRQLFTVMASMTKQLLYEDYPVVIDSCALRKAERDLFRQAAQGSKCPVILLLCQAPDKTLKLRIEHRLQTGRDPSKAWPELVDLQKQWVEPPFPEEKQSLITIDTSQSDWKNTLKKRLAAML